MNWVKRGETKKEIVKKKQLEQISRISSRKKHLENLIVFFIWIFLFVLLFQLMGICYIHEAGHYIIGQFAGCKDLAVSCSTHFLSPNSENLGNSGSVSGWEYCNQPILVSGNGNKVCNRITIVNHFSGFLITLFSFISLILAFNFLLKKKFPVFHLNKNFLTLLIFLVLIQSVYSSATDLSKVSDCFLSPSSTEVLHSSILNLPSFLVIMLFLFVIISLFKMLFVSSIR